MSQVHKMQAMCYGVRFMTFALPECGIDFAIQHLQLFPSKILFTLPLAIAQITLESASDYTTAHNIVKFLIEVL